MEKLPIKLVCFDMDGTLFAEHHTVPEINVRAIRDCAARGIRTAIISGRNFRFIMDITRKIIPDMIIVSANGARIDEKPGGKCLLEDCFKPADAAEVLKIAWELGVYFEIYTGSVNYLFRSDIMPESHRKSLENYLRLGEVPEIAEPKRIEDTPLDGIYKFVCFSDDIKKIHEIRNTFDRAGWVHSSSTDRSVEVMGRGVDKGSALRFLSSHYGIPKDQIMAFGDFTNDMSLIREAGHGVAMENGVDELKAIARHIAPPNTEGGVGQLLYELVL